MSVYARGPHLAPVAPDAVDGLFSNVLTIVLATLLLGGAYISVDAFSAFPLVMTLLIVNGGLAILGQLQSISVQSPMHYISFLFSYLFLSVMPILQIGFKIDPVFSFREVVLLASVAGLSFTVFGLLILKRLKRSEVMIQPPSTREITHKDERPHYMLLALLVAAFTIATFAIFRGHLFTSREAFANAVAAHFGEKTTGGAFSNFLMQAPFFGAVMGLRAALAKRHGFWIATFSLLLLASLIINNPLISARFKLAGLVFFFLDYFFRGKSIKLIIAILVLGIFLAPMFQMFRHGGTNISSTTYGDKYISTDYDAFQMMCYTFLTVDRNGLSLGSNISGATLFWVPRSIWRAKPEPSSFEIYFTAHRYKEVGTNNLSVPLMIEGYYAFSWVGLCLISILWWWGITSLHTHSQKNSDSLTFVLRCVITGVVLIILRGPLVIGVTAVVGNFAAALLVWRVFRNSQPRLPLSAISRRLSGVREPTRIGS
jgi:hypothetical protein